MTPQLPRLIAHRGYTQAYPENTLLSLDAAVRAGARFVEFDVQLTSDEVPVVMHDSTFARTAGQPGSVWETEAAGLRSIGVNEVSRLGGRFPEARIPTLEEVALWLKGLPKVTAFVELKIESLRHFGIRKVVSRVLRVLEPVPAQCVLISFEARALLLARDTGAMALGWVLPYWDRATLTHARGLKPEYVFCDRRLIPPGWGGFAHYPWHWAVYEVTEAEEALAWAARGVGFIETMAIGEILRHPLFLAADNRHRQD